MHPESLDKNLPMKEMSEVSVFCAFNTYTFTFTCSETSLNIQRNTWIRSLFAMNIYTLLTTELRNLWRWCSKCFLDAAARGELHGASITQTISNISGETSMGVLVNCLQLIALLFLMWWLLLIWWRLDTLRSYKCHRTETNDITWRNNESIFYFISHRCIAHNTVSKSHHLIRYIIKTLFNTTL